MKSSKLIMGVHPGILRFSKRVKDNWVYILRPEDCRLVLVYDARCQWVSSIFVIRVDLERVLDTIRAVLHSAMRISLSSIRYNKLNFCCVKIWDFVLALVHRVKSWVIFWAIKPSYTSIRFREYWLVPSKHVTCQARVFRASTKMVTIWVRSCS